MAPISAWTATFQNSLKKGTLLTGITLNDHRLKIVVSEFCLWIVAEWPKGGKVAFRAAFAATHKLEVESIKEAEGIELVLKGDTEKIKVSITTPHSDKSIFRYTTVIIPEFDMLMPFCPRDIMPLFKNGGNTQKTKGTIHAAQVGTRSGLLFFSFGKPQTGSVFYFQDLGSLNKYCADTETSAADLVGGVWPELGMKLHSERHNYT